MSKPAHKCTCGTCSCNNGLARPRMSLVTMETADPTHTLTLRNQFSREMKKRFKAVRGAIRKTVVNMDCFGLTGNASVVSNVFTDAAGVPTQPRAFAFPRSQDKVTAFMDWLRELEKDKILEVSTQQQLGRAVESAWTNKYITTAYQKGIARGREELRRAGYVGRNGEPVPSLEETGGIRVAFNQPFHIDRVGLLYTRTFSDLEGITNAMDGQISRILAQGIADGDNPVKLAQLLTKTISGPFGDLSITDTLGRFIPAERRATMLARTEVIRAHHQAMIQEYRNWGAEEVIVKAEWSTAGDNRVCPDCASLEGRVFELDRIEGMIPLHTLCRCIALPVVQEDSRRR